MPGEEKVLIGRAPLSGSYALCGGSAPVGECVLLFFLGNNLSRNFPGGITVVHVGIYRKRKLHVSVVSFLPGIGSLP